ncbi:MAG: asparagine synthase (glutamine-hydrolyzing), partial [Clostridia bacterium]|nr:asparagine synthase (glutamine-hydrolyzing) [Clostridia bacterium]
MCSICGIYDYKGEGCGDIALMSGVMAHRGPDAAGSFCHGGVALGHNRLSVMDPERGAQPMTATYRGREYTIVYNGEIYNSDALRSELRHAGIRPATACDTELVLYSYILFGEEAPKHLNGIFAFAVYDKEAESLFLARDRLGVKPLYFAEHRGRFYFASEIKGILAGSGMPARLGEEGLFELLYLAPVSLTTSGILEGIRQVEPGGLATVTRRGLRLGRYWMLAAADMTVTRAAAIENTRTLISDAVRRQLVSDVPLATFLSGGLDSSAITAIAAEEYRRRGARLATYSFEYEDNKSYAPTLFQPNRDDDFAARLAAELGTEHTVLTVPTATLAHLLPEAATKRDMPGQADIDSSLLFFCGEVKKRHTVALSGECADEIFGGYPWFYRPEMLSRGHFPWVHDETARASLFDPAIAKIDEGRERLRDVTERAVASAPLTGYENPEDRTARIATWLSVNYFMTNLLARKDRMSMARGLEVRVPFADHRILEYLYNVPWSI